MKVLVTGGTGFIGSHLIPKLINRGDEVTLIARRNPYGNTVHFIQIDDLLNIGPVLNTLHQPIDVIIHLAARVHKMNEVGIDLDVLYNQFNVGTTKSLADYAIKNGIKKFIYMSSVKAYGEDRELPYQDAVEPIPHDSYGRSKLNAENVLLGYSGLDIIILRPPLVYGPGVKGNFIPLLKMANLPIPLPFAGVDNKRSFIYVGNLCEFICDAMNVGGVHRVFVSDGEPQSLCSLLKMMRKHLKNSAPLFYFPLSLIQFALRIIGKEHFNKRLFSNLYVDSSLQNNLFSNTKIADFDTAMGITVSAIMNNQTLSTPNENI